MSQIAHSSTSISRFLRWTLAVTLVLVTANAQSQPLNDDTIEAFIDSLGDVESVMPDGEHDRLSSEPDDDQSIDFTRLFSDTIEELSKHPPTREKMAAMAQRHGFEDLEQWAETGDRIYSAYMAMNMGGQAAMTQQDVDQYMASIEDSPLPEAEKASMRNMMESTLLAQKALRNTPQEDIEAVRPYADKLMQIQMMDEDDGY